MDHIEGIAAAKALAIRATIQRELSKRLRVQQCRAAESPLSAGNATLAYAACRTIYLWMKQEMVHWRRLSGVRLICRNSLTKPTPTVVTVECSSKQQT